MNSTLRAARIPVLTFVAVTLALISWTAFTVDPRNYLLPAMAIGIVIAGSGIAARAFRCPVPVTVLIQTFLGVCATSVATCGALLPVTGAARDRLAVAFEQASETVLSTQVPVPVGDGGVGPYLVVGAFVCYLLADVIAGSLRHATVAGLVLLGVVAVPVSVPGGSLPWWAFVLATAGFLVLLFAHEQDRVARWGRPLGEAGTGTELRHRTEAGAGVVGMTATALALVVPIAVPTLSLDLVGFGDGGSDDGPIRVTNPTVGMYDDLRFQSPTPLVLVETEGPLDTAPSYLRIATLTSFNGREWTPGKRQVPADQDADGPLPLPVGGSDVLGKEVTYTLTATDSFESRWLPTFLHTTEIHAEGPWRYDTATTDFIATDTDGEVDLANDTWQVTAAEMSPSPETLRNASSSEAMVDARFTQLPRLPDEVEQIAEEHTDAYDSPFEKAVALQEWFARSGEFTYSLDRPGTVVGTGAEDLVAFLTDNKIGYCQQYATAMAALARTINIPARVAVGFLRGEEEPTTGGYVFRGRDMHAWPELWFDDVGWVRFDPTPAAAGSTPPSYTQGVLDSGDGGIQNPGLPLPQTNPDADPAPAPAPAPGQNEGQQQGGPAADGDESRAGTQTGFVALALAVLALVALAAPALIRRRRRARRQNGGPEDGWAELRDTARDLGLGWSDDVSPRVTGRRLGTSLTTQEAREALARVVVAVERGRYARAATPVEVHHDVAVVRDALIASVVPGTARRAAVWPRSVLTRPEARAERRDEELTDLMS